MVGRFDIIMFARQLAGLAVVDGALISRCLAHRDEEKHLALRTHENVLTAVECGHVEVIQFLFDKGFTRIGNDVTRAAVRGDKLVSLEWLADHIWEDYPEHFEYATEDAAQFGRLDMLKFLHNLYHSQQYEVVGKKRRLRSGGTFSWSANLFFWAASGDQVAVLKWLQGNRCDKSVFYAMESAAGAGYLDIVKWLHANGCERCSTTAMLFAAQNGHFEIVKWLYENYPETRLRETIVRAIHYGHFRIAYWLRKKYPDADTEGSVVAQQRLGKFGKESNALETLLFLHALYPGVLTPRNRRDIRQFYISSYKQSHTVELLLGWLEANYPSTAEITD